MARAIRSPAPSWRSTVGLLLGTLLGLMAGSRGGWSDAVIMRLVDVLLAMPSLLLSLSIIVLLGFGTINVAIAVGVIAIARFARLARSEVVRVRRSEYVEAAFGSGGTFCAVLWRHVLPNSLTSVIALAALQFGSAILADLDPRLPGLRRAAADAGMGPADRRRPQLPLARLVADGRSRHRGGPRGPVGQSHQPVDSDRRRHDWHVPLLEIDDLAIAYKTGDHDQRVVHGVSFRIEPGEVVALVGESGSGKTTTAQAVIGLLADNGRIERGAIRLNGTDIAGWPQRRLDAIRGAVVSLIPQDPGSSLNPVQTIGAQVAEVLQIHKRGDRKAIHAACSSF